MSTQLSAHGRAAPPGPRHARTGRWSTARQVRIGAALLVAVAITVRGWLVAGRDYFNDDLRLLHLADQHPLLSPAYLFHDHDGQFMPGGFLVIGLAERIAPLQWWPAALSIVALQVLASVALLRLLRVLLGDRPLLLVPLAFGLFTPLTLGSTAWWAAALNSLPLQAGLAWFLADAVLLARTGSRRYARGGTVAFAVSLLFYLKAVLIPWVGVAVVALVLLRDGERAPLALTWHRARALWTRSLAVTGVWAVVFLLTRNRDPVAPGDLGDLLATIGAGWRALAAAVLGGPSGWFTEPPQAPTATVPVWLWLAGALLLLTACVWTCRRRRGAAAVWALVVAEVTGGLVIAAAGRGALGLGDTLPLACRYYAVEAVLLPVAGALLATLPPRDGGTAALPPSVLPLLRTAERTRATLLARVPGLVRAASVARAAARTRAAALTRAATPAAEAAVARVPALARLAGRPGDRSVPVTTAATVVFVLLALVATAGYHRAWQVDRSGAYLAAARESLAAAGPAPLLDQTMPADVMWTLSHPGNLLSRVLSPLEDRPDFADSTTDLRVVDDAGHLRAGDVAPRTTLFPGPWPDCGWAVGSGEDTVVVMDRLLPAWEWTAELNYAADRDGVVVLALPSGEAVRAEVRAGVNTLYVRLAGEGRELRMAAQTPDLVLCVGGGVVGDAVVA